MKGYSFFYNFLLLKEIRNDKIAKSYSYLIKYLWQRTGKVYLVQIINGKIIHNGIDYIYQDLVIRDGTVCRIKEPFQEPEEDLVVDAEGGFILPGLIDINYIPADLNNLCRKQPASSPVHDRQNEADPVTALSGESGSYASCAAKHGTLSYIAPVHAAPDSFSQALADAASLYFSESEDARLLGIRLADPLSIAEGDSLDGILALLRQIDEACGGCLQMLTVRPEQPGIARIVSSAKDSFHFSMQSAAAGFEQSNRVLTAGADLLSDPLECITAMTASQPGVLPALLQSDACIEFSIDPRTAHAAVIRMLFQILPPDRLILTGAACRPGEYLLDILTLAVNYGVPLPLAVKSVTENPARFLGLENEYGFIQEGRRADLVILDLHDLHLRTVVSGGTLIYDSGGHTMYGG